MFGQLLWLGGHCYYNDIKVWFIETGNDVGTWALRRAPFAPTTQPLRSLTGRTVRIVASALAPWGGSSQPVTVGTYYDFQ
jgi:hypothetical protein